MFVYEDVSDAMTNMSLIEVSLLGTLFFVCVFQCSGICS